VKRILFFMLFIGISGCATSFEEPWKERVTRLENGMTEHDVWKLLGPAVKIKEKANKKVYVYYPNKNNPKRPYFVRFIDKEVVGWGPARKKKYKKR